MNDELIEQLAALSNNPLGYAYWAYPWGELGTELEEYEGPDYWQREAFGYIANELQAGHNIIRLAVRSGHGVGKSAFSSILIDWGMSTLEGTKGVVTANTERQLRTKTWVELAKWRRLSLTKELFKLKATAMFSNDPAQRSEWRFDMSPWSERNTEAFAGLHNKNKRIILIMDESSGIADIVWEVAEGAMTDENTQIIWVALGNPTKNTGRFRECFEGGRYAHRWKQISVDGRKSAFTNKTLINDWVKDHGLDSDFIRVRVLGEFPKHDVSSFISRDIVADALERDARSPEDPVVIGVDPARYGNDASVIFPRQGRDARSRPVERFQGLDTMTLASRVAETYSRYNAQMIYVDGTGMGAGVVDRLREMNFPVHEVNFSSKADNFSATQRGVRYANKRTEIHAELREWLGGAAIQDFEVDRDHTMIDDLTVTQYYYNSRDEIQLEPKEEIRRREGWSPDLADALAVTFAMPFLHAIAAPLPGADYQSSRNWNPYQNIRRLYHDA